VKNILIVTGGAGFVGSNLIEELLKIKGFKIISVDNYSSGKVQNHINDKNIKYFRADTCNIIKTLSLYRKKIHTIFHFGEFARIYKSFEKISDCFNSNIKGTNEVFKFALENKIKLIYSATSASLGNNGEDMNLSPYTFTKAKNLELLENLKKWFKFKYEVVYFYNVYGPRQICKGDMATVVGIFEDHYIKKRSFPVVRPGSQTRRFTHIKDTIATCLFAWKRNMNSHYSIASNQSYSIVELARMFGGKIKYLPARSGERFSSALKRINLGNKIIQIKAKTKLKDYISIFLKKNIKSSLQRLN
jgi:UDP-glucose 4-epimerase